MTKARRERREWAITQAGAERDAGGRMTKRVVWFACPFCGAEVKAYVWSLSGRGKRCECGAFHFVGASEAPAQQFRLEETPGSRHGRREVEVFAPDGFTFDGERHSVVARARTLWAARDAALEEARAATLVACADDCDCREEP